jgi:hypothetical protein
MCFLTKFLMAVLMVGAFAGVRCQAQELNSYSHQDSMWWVTSGVTMQVAGSFADWATSWKQPEGNSLLAQPSGEYSGRFYRTGTARKGLLSGGIALVSYAIAWKFPKTRKFVGVFNMSVGAGFAVAAFRNAENNPYYKP